MHEPGPARDHTERMLAHFGVVVESQRTGSAATIRLCGGQELTSGGRLDVPGDFSSAAFPLVAAVLVPSSAVRLIGVGVNPTRTGLYDLLESMGAAVGMEEQPPTDVTHPASAAGEPMATVSGRSSALTGIEVGGEVVVRAIDEFPIFAVAATQAAGTTVIRDAAELRVKESDRIAAVCTELRKMGADVEERPDGMRIHGPARLHGALVDSHHDHRLAMSLAAAGSGATANSPAMAALKMAGVMGWPVAHSLSPRMHNAAFAALGLDWVYVPFPVRPERLADAVRGLVALGFAGCNATVPHKAALVPLMDELTPIAAATGSRRWWIEWPSGCRWSNRARSMSGPGRRR